MTECRSADGGGLQADQKTLQYKNLPAATVRFLFSRLIERDFVGRAVVELCRPRALMRGDRLRVLERSTIKQIGP
jgi:hypothetical protein